MMKLLLSILLAFPAICSAQGFGTQGTGFSLNVADVVNEAILEGDIPVATGTHTTDNDDVADSAHDADILTNAVDISTTAQAALAAQASANAAQATANAAVEKAGDTMAGELIIQSSGTANNFNTAGDGQYNLDGVPVIKKSQYGDVIHKGVITELESDGFTPLLEMTAYGNGRPLIRPIRYKGTKLASTTVTNGTLFLDILAKGYNGSKLRNGPLIRLRATETWDDTTPKSGSEIQMWTTPNGTDSQVASALFKNNGELAITGTLRSGNDVLADGGYIRANRQDATSMLDQHTAWDAVWGPIINMKKSRGTIGSPTEVESGDRLGEWRSLGWDGGWDLNALIINNATENFGPGNNGNEWNFYNKANGTSNLVNPLTIENSGDLNIYGNDLIVGGTVDGVDVSAHAGDANAHHAAVDVSGKVDKIGDTMTGTLVVPELRSADSASPVPDFVIKGGDCIGACSGAATILEGGGGEAGAQVYVTGGTSDVSGNGTHATLQGGGDLGSGNGGNAIVKGQYSASGQPGDVDIKGGDTVGFQTAGDVTVRAGNGTSSTAGSVFIKAGDSDSQPNGGIVSFFTDNVERGRWRENGNLLVNESIEVLGTVDGVDIAARDHAPTVDTSAFTQCAAGEYLSGTNTCDAISAGAHFTLDDDIVTSAKIADGAVTTAKLDRSYVQLDGDEMTGSLNIRSAGAIAAVVESETWAGVILGRVSTNASPAVYQSKKARGSIAIPLAIENGDALGDTLAMGHDGAGYFTGSRIRSQATENWTGASRGTELSVSTVKDGTNFLNESILIDSSADVTFSDDIIIAGLVDGVDVSAHAADGSAHHAPVDISAKYDKAGGNITGNAYVMNASLEQRAEGVTGKRLLISEYNLGGGGPIVRSLRKAGSVASSGAGSAITNGMSLRTDDVWGYDGVSNAQSAKIVSAANQAWSAGNHGTKITFYRAKNGETTPTAAFQMAGGGINYSFVKLNMQNNNIEAVGTVDGVDISGLETTVSGKVNKAGDTLTGPLLAADGLFTAPSYSFASNTGAGMFVMPGGNVRLQKTSNDPLLELQDSGIVIHKNILGVQSIDMSGDITMDAFQQVDGVDVSAHAADASAHHAEFVLADGDVTSAKILDGAVTTAKLDRLYVESAGGTMTGLLRLPTIGGQNSIAIGNGDSGIQSTGDNSYSLRAAGVPVLAVQSTQLILSAGVDMRIDNGTVGSPGINFRNSGTSGIYAPSNDLVAVSVLGTQRLLADTGGVSVTGNLAVTGTVDGIDVAARDHDVYTLDAGAVTSDKIADDAVTTAKLDREYVETAGDTMTGELALADGLRFTTNGLYNNPTIRLASDPSGANIYASGNTMTLALNDADTLPTAHFSSSGFNVKAHVRADGGSLGSPGLSFYNDTNTGVWDGNGDDLTLIAGGVSRLRVGQYGNIFNQSLSMATNDITSVGAYASVSDQFDAISASTDSLASDIATIESNDWVTSAKIADNAVTTSKILDGSVTTEKLAFSTWTQAVASEASFNTLGGLEIQDETFAELIKPTSQEKGLRFETGNNSGGYPISFRSGDGVEQMRVDNAGLTIIGGTAVNPPTGWVLGNSNSTGLAKWQERVFNGDITTAKLASDAVTSIKIADNAVTTSEILDGAVTSSKIGFTSLTLSGEMQAGTLVGNGSGITGVAAQSIGISTHSVEGEVTTTSETFIETFTSTWTAITSAYEVTWSAEVTNTVKDKGIQFQIFTDGDEANEFSSHTYFPANDGDYAAIGGNFITDRVAGDFGIQMRIHAITSNTAKIKRARVKIKQVVVVN